METPRAISGGRSKGRAAGIRAGHDRKRASITLAREWNPCLWCGQPIGERRAKDATMRGQRVKYCSDECRRNEPGKSLVMHLFGCALESSPSDESKWKASFDARLALATLSDREMLRVLAASPKTPKGKRK